MDHGESLSFCLIILCMSWVCQQFSLNWSVFMRAVEQDWLRVHSSAIKQRHFRAIILTVRGATRTIFIRRAAGTIVIRRATRVSIIIGLLLRDFKGFGIVDLRCPIWGSLHELRDWDVYWRLNDLYCNLYTIIIIQPNIMTCYDEKLVTNLDDISVMRARECTKHWFRIVKVLGLPLRIFFLRRNREYDFTLRSLTG